VKLITERDEFRHIVRARIELEDPETEIGRLKTAIHRMMHDFQKRLETLDEPNEVERRRLARHYQNEIALYEKLYEALTPQAEQPWPEDES
jgi:signal transduction protein with GAF and PtsI domain